MIPVSNSLLGTWTLLCLLGLVAGCGCFYDSEIVDVSVEPDPGCLDLEAYGECASVVLSGTNACEDPLVFQAWDGAEEYTVTPGESFSLDTFAAEKIEDDQNCYVTFIVDAHLGTQPLLLEFTIARVNRGAALPCS